MIFGEQGTLFASMRALVRELTIDLSDRRSANVHVLWLDRDDTELSSTIAYHVFVNDRNSRQVPLDRRDLSRFEAALNSPTSAPRIEAAKRWLQAHSPANEADVAMGLLDGRIKPTNSHECRSGFHLLYSAVPGVVDQDVISTFIGDGQTAFRFTDDLTPLRLAGPTGWKIVGRGSTGQALLADVQVWNDKQRRVRGVWHGSELSELHEALRCLIPGERRHGDHQVYVIAPVFVHGCLVGLAYVILDHEPPQADFAVLASRLEHRARVVLPPSMQVYRFAEFDRRILRETSELLDRSLSPPRKSEIEKLFLRHVHLLVRTAHGDRPYDPSTCQEIAIRHDEGMFHVRVHQDQLRLNREHREAGELVSEARMRAQVLKQVLRTKFANACNALRLDTERNLTRAEAALSELEHDLKNLHEGMTPHPTATDLNRWLAWISNNTRSIRANLTGTEQPVDTRMTYSGEPLMEMLSKVAASTANISAVELPERVPAAVVSLLAQLLLNLQTDGATLRVWREDSGLHSLETSAPTIPTTATLIRRRVERWVALRDPSGRGIPLSETHGTLVILGVLHRIRTPASHVSWQFSASAQERKPSYAIFVSQTPSLVVKGEATDVRHLSFRATHLQFACREQ